MRAVDGMLSLAAGFMISVAFVDMIPEAIEIGGASAGATVLFGYLAVHLTQHTIARHFHFGEETHEVSKVLAASIFHFGQFSIAEAKAALAAAGVAVRP